MKTKNYKLLKRIVNAFIYIYNMYIVENIKILGIMLICQMIKGSKEKFFLLTKFSTKISDVFFRAKVFRKKMPKEHIYMCVCVCSLYIFTIYMCNIRVILTLEPLGHQNAIMLLISDSVAGADHSLEERA